MHHRELVSDLELFRQHHYYRVWLAGPGCPKPRDDTFECGLLLQLVRKHSARSPMTAVGRDRGVDAVAALEHA